MRPNGSVTTSAKQPADADMPLRIGERYHVRALLGRGGMATVYRVSDASGGPDLALKQLHPPSSVQEQAPLRTLFEREFQTLVELAHPRVIRVHDYGVTEQGPFYTMELLDGGSLSDFAPLPWRAACALVHDICSSLSLLHVRRLVHRDVSPHNVRRTADGRAKLIDFGAMASMGPSERVIGTPAFTAPEVVRQLALDARTDLFSLGATLYFALTGTLAYPARTFSQLTDAWSVSPLQPSTLNSDIPIELDALVTSMLSLEPALRPRSASEVMMQLATLLGGADDEHADVRRAYLSTPRLTGRDDLLQRFGRRIARARAQRGGSLLIDAVAGMGRSRALEACSVYAQTQGCLVARTSSTSLDLGPFGVAQRLTEQLALALPDSCLEVACTTKTTELLFAPPDDAAACDSPLRLRTRAFAVAGTERALTQDALTAFWLELARSRVVVMVVDDLDRIDEPSAAWLATVAVQARKYALVLVFSMLTSERTAPAAQQLIARRSSRRRLRPLSAVETESLLMSAFGDVPHVSMLADRVHRVARGNPGATMDLTQALIERGTISYLGGTWSLPAKLSVSDLPETMDEAFAARVASLSTPARRLAELHALSSYGALSVDDQHLLTQHDALPTERIRTELLDLAVLVQEGDRFAIVHESWVSALTRGLDGAQRAERHRALGELGAQTQRSAFASAYHLFCAGQPADGLAVLRPVLRSEIEQGTFTALVAPERIGQVLRWALSHAESEGSRPRELADLRRWLCSVSLASDDAFYDVAAPNLLADLRRDSGLSDWLALTHVADRQARLGAALTRANERYQALHESERVFSVQDAIKFLVQHVAVSIAIGTRTLNQNILAGLPSLLEPFTALSPIIDAIHENALATCECGIEGRYPQARARWQAVYTRLEHVSRENLPYVDAIRAAIAFGLGCLEAARGLPAAAERAAQLDADPMHRVNAMYLRRVMRLQQGDFEGAEQYRRQAELLAVQINARQMFTTMLLVELAAYVTARDLTGVREITERMTELAERAPGWRTYKTIAQGCLKFLRGDLRSARVTLESALTQCWPDADEPLRALGPFPVAAGVLLEVLIAQQAYGEARELGVRALAVCARVDIQTVDEIERGLALAEAKLGDVAGATARVEAVIARELSQGVCGLHLGTMYEARTRIAVWAGDRAALDHYSRLTAAEYRHGRSSPLGARYERLMHEARRAGIAGMTTASASEMSALGTTVSATSAQALLEHAIAGANTSEARNGALVRLLTESTGASAAHLYLVQPDASLRWVSSSPGTPAAGDHELAQARECLARALDDDFGSTGVLSELGSSEAGGSNTWPQSLQSPRAYLLTAAQQDDIRHVAVVVCAQSSMQAHSHPVFAVIAAYLAQSDATQGYSLKNASLDERDAP